MTDKPCCEWKGSVNLKGYGVVTIDGKQFKVHRLAVILSGRKIPKGMVTDHLCRNKLCINPEHLDVVTNEENVMRGESFSAINSKKDRCINGHPYSEHGRFYINKNFGKGKTWRLCKLCKTTRRKELKLQNEKRS